MRKIFAVVIIFVALIACVGCGEYGDFEGTYVKSSSSSTVTIKLTSTGNFSYNRDKKGSSYDPYNNDKYNKMSGTFKAVEGEKNRISITFTYYDEIRGYIEDTVTATVSGGKLIISNQNDRVNGTYTKQ